MRILLALAASLVLLPLAGSPAAGSCAPPAPPSENAARAAAVVYGSVVSGASASITIHVDRVLKGRAGPTLSLYLGPGRGGAGGTAVATSVDYAAAVGTDHVLYVTTGADGQLETNACAGSHPGQPTAAELASLGAGSPPDPGVADTAIAPSGTPWPILIGLGAGGALVVFLAGRRVSSSRGSPRR